MTPLINGVRHSWSSIRLVLFGRMITGITEIKYKSSREKEDFYGAGDMPVHRGRGNKKATSSLKMYKYEIDAIQKSLPIGKDLTDITAFDISVSFLPEGSDKTLEVVLHNCEFTDVEFSGKQGDKMLEIDCPLIISHITYK